MKILLFGKNGQVGWELQRSLSTIGELVSVDSSDKNICGDLKNPAGITETIHQIKPNVVVNAAAHTAVDKAETEKELAYQLNTHSVEIIAKETAKIGALFIHYSTDYVFNGDGNHYQAEHELPGPLNIYGASKLAGEQAIINHNPRYFIFRTSWIYAARGSNFIKTILRLAHEQENISIINDQYGAPTGAELLADCTAIAIRAEIKNKTDYGIYHLSAGGETTWFDYANHVIEIVRKQGNQLILKSITPVPTTSYPLPAKRPYNSRLSSQKFQNAFHTPLPQWQKGVERVVIELLNK